MKEQEEEAEEGTIKRLVVALRDEVLGLWGDQGLAMKVRC